MTTLGVRARLPAPERRQDFIEVEEKAGRESL